MSEIKFACPHCRQHIACDPGFVDMCIVCPTCGKPMVVPVLSAGDSAHPEMCVVASPPAPRRQLTTHIPQLEVWKAEEWEERLRSSDANGMSQLPVWVLALLATMVFAVILRTFRSPTWVIVTLTIAGLAATAYFMIKSDVTPQTTMIHRILTCVLVLVVAVPAILIGVLFVGCCAMG